MNDLAAILDTVRRPKILIRAARAGVPDYRRDRDLKRLLRRTPRNAINPLITEESRMEENRTSGAATYSLQRHIAVLTALIAEARAVPLVREQQRLAA